MVAKVFMVLGAGGSIDQDGGMRSRRPGNPTHGPPSVIEDQLRKIVGFDTDHKRFILG